MWILCHKTSIPKYLTNIVIDGNYTSEGYQKSQTTIKPTFLCKTVQCTRTLKLYFDKTSQEWETILNQKITEWHSEWQGRLLGCSRQLKIDNVPDSNVSWKWGQRDWHNMAVTCPLPCRTHNQSMKAHTQTIYSLHFYTVWTLNYWN